MSHGVPVEQIPAEVALLRAATRIEQETCYHEGAHAVACMEFGYPIEFVKMGTGFFGAANGTGMVRTRGEDESRVNIDELVISFLVGTEAERCLHSLDQVEGSYDPTGGGSDLVCVEYYLRTYGGNLTALRAKSARFVETRWGRIEGVAAVLLIKHRLSAAQAKKAAAS